MVKRIGFGQRLAKLRAEKGYSKSSFARALNVSTTCVWNWEEDNTFPRPAPLKRMAEVLDTTSAYLETGQHPAGTEGSDGHSTEARTWDSAAASAAPAGENRNLASLITQYRDRIASAAGLHIDQVRVTLEYGREA
jgi:transcriptional regulator with XRE-family HTH domain